MILRDTCKLFGMFTHVELDPDSHEIFCENMCYQNSRACSFIRNLEVGLPSYIRN